MPPQKLVQAVREPASAVDAAIDKITAAKRQAEWEDMVKLAESIFPKDWTVRVEQFSQESFVQIRFIAAYGRDPIDALRKAIEWYRGQARLVIPPTGAGR